MTITEIINWSFENFPTIATIGGTIIGTSLLTIRNVREKLKLPLPQKRIIMEPVQRLTDISPVDEIAKDLKIQSDLYRTMIAAINSLKEGQDRLIAAVNHVGESIDGIFEIKEKEINEIEIQRRVHEELRRERSQNPPDKRRGNWRYERE
jgi:hypothetical protein